MTERLEGEHNNSQERQGKVSRLFLTEDGEIRTWLAHTGYAMPDGWQIDVATTDEVLSDDPGTAYANQGAKELYVQETVFTALARQTIFRIFKSARSMMSASRS